MTCKAFNLKKIHSAWAGESQELLGEKLGAAYFSKPYARLGSGSRSQRAMPLCIGGGPPSTSTRVHATTRYEGFPTLTKLRHELHEDTENVVPTAFAGMGEDAGSRYIPEALPDLRETEFAF